MQNLIADIQYAFCTTNMWFNFQAHHHREYAAMETQDQATHSMHYRINEFIIGKQTIDYREYCLSHYRDRSLSTINQFLGIPFKMVFIMLQLATS